MPDPISERTAAPSPEALRLLDELACLAYDPDMLACIDRHLEAFRREGVEKERERCVGNLEKHHHLIAIRNIREGFQP